MKVEQEGTGFAPITIILETKEEADIMWSLLNSPTKVVVENSFGNLSSDEVRDLAQQMFCAFDDIHPTGW